MSACTSFCSQRKKDRRRLKRFSNFLTANREWLCEGDCKHKLKQSTIECSVCIMEGMIKYSLKANKKCTRSTFVNSAMFEQFIKVENLYEGYIEKKNLRPAIKEPLSKPTVYKLCFF